MINPHEVEADELVFRGYPLGQDERRQSEWQSQLCCGMGERQAPEEVVSRVASEFLFQV